MGEQIESEEQQARNSPQRKVSPENTPNGTYGAVTGLHDAHPSIDLSYASLQRNKGCFSKIFPCGYWAEFKELQKLAWPIILTEFFKMFLGPMALIFCGHLGEIELDAVALANSMINVTGISIATGLSSACDTLFSQTYGSIHKRKLGVYLQRSLCIITLGIFPCWAIHLNAEALLNFIGQDPGVSRLTADYLLIFMPGLLFLFLFIPLSKYIQNQNIVYPNLFIGIICNAINALLQYIFVMVLEMSTRGSAIAQVISYFCMFFFTLMYILVTKVYKETWNGWSVECLQDWLSFLRLAMFGLIMLCVEWWSFEVGIFLTGIIGTTELGSQSVLFQLEAIAYMLPLGTGIAVSIRVGQYLGSGNHLGAMTAARVAITFIWCTAILVAILFASLKDYLPMIFTNVPAVISYAAGLLPILAIYMVSDSTAGVIAGVLRGCGRQMLGAVVIVIGWTIALSAGIPVMFNTTLGIAGFWWALAGGLTLEAIVFLVILIKTNWQKQVELASNRLEGSTEATVSYEKGHSKPTIHNSLLSDDENFNDERRGFLENEENSYPPSLPTDPLLKRSTSTERSRKYSSSYHGYIEEPLPPPGEKLSTKTLVLRRVATAIFMILVFGAGLVLRFVNKIEEPTLDTCIPIGDLKPINSSLPFCANSTTTVTPI